MKIIAHRGSSAKYPENTLLAFEKALEAGVDGIETDLRLSFDEEVILFHDDDLKRITGMKGSPEAFTLKRLKELDAGGGERIPTLDELLQLTQEKTILILEIKYNPATYKRLCQVIAEKIKERQEWIEVSCFDDRVLLYLNGLDPRIRLHKLIDEADVLEDPEFEKKYAYVKYLDIDIALRNIVQKRRLTEKNKIIFWVGGQEEIQREEDAGVYGVMVNDLSMSVVK